MTDYRVTYFWTQALDFDVEDLKQEFPEEWEEFSGNEEEFIESIIDVYGFSFLEELDFLQGVEEYKGYVEVNEL